MADDRSDDLNSTTMSNFGLNSSHLPRTENRGSPGSSRALDLDKAELRRSGNLQLFGVRLTRC